jgi:two-component system copper resistance phosphate regulon response regulator CusR
VEALGRRPKEIRDPVLRVGDLELDNATREVHRGGERIDLTPKACRSTSLRGKW